LFPVRIVTLLSIVTATACITPPPITDPHATGLNMNQWRATVSGPPSKAFDVAMQVLTDSSYKIADARKDVGMISTDYRKESDVQRGMAQLQTMNVSLNYPIRLQLVILARGSDSSTVTITGEEMLENISRTLPIGARTGEWRFVRGIGDALLATLPR
jgi:hypothetical protein